MKLTTLKTSLKFLLSSISAAMASPTLVPDVPTSVAGIESVCTGIGLDTRQDPRWNNYSLKVEIVGPGGQYLGDEGVTVRRSGKELISLSCSGPWILFQLPQGRYEVEARIGAQTASSAAFVPATGQGRIILRFAGDAQ